MKFGPGFPESIGLGKAVKRHYNPVPRESRRIVFAPILALLLFITLIVFLLKAQIFQGSYFRELSDGNRIREDIIRAPRGVIYDTNGIPLVHNVPGFIIKDETGKTKIVERTEALSLISSKDQSQLTIDSLRQYVSPLVFAHVTGFIGEISKEELSSGNYKDYRGGDFVGKTGTEKEYEYILKGIDGKQLVEVTNTGEPSRILGKVDAATGKDITLSIDKKLSEAAFSAMENVEHGVVIVSDPKTGEILVLISKPTFDPNLFTLGEHYKSSSASAYPTVESILSDDFDRPMFNRAIAGAYPPGSTFKIITAAAGLEQGKITADTEIEDIGVIKIGAFSFPNWYFLQYGKTDGFVDVVKALKRSNDIFFYKVAEMAGLDDLGRMAKLFGVGERLGIDIPGEEPGLFPSDEWKREAIGDKWYLGDTYHLGIGQGYLLTTPLQVNAWTAVLANNGTLCQPSVVKSEKCKVKSFDKAQDKSEKFLKKETIDLIKKGMREACAPGGTGWPLFEFRAQNPNLVIDDKNFFEAHVGTSSAVIQDFVHIPVACKTGTAEFGDPKDRTHAWFTAFAPIEDPEIVVTVLVEAGGEGSNVAAPIAKKIFEGWFSR